MTVVNSSLFSLIGMTVLLFRVENNSSMRSFDCFFDIVLTGVWMAMFFYMSKDFANAI